MVVITFKNELTNDIGLIELQGRIEISSLDSAEIDVASFYWRNGVPTLRIGNQLLTGCVKKLNKPYAIVHKKDSMNHSIVSIIREKYLFSTRPQSILHE